MFPGGGGDGGGGGGGGVLVWRRGVPKGWFLGPSRLGLSRVKVRVGG